ncbi:hypothetical protein ACLB1O_16770 [Escherichia coli]
MSNGFSQQLEDLSSSQADEALAHYRPTALSEHSRGEEPCGCWRSCPVVSACDLLWFMPRSYVRR